MEIKGKNALVTGAGAGIGEASALMLAENGAAKVVIVDIDEGNLKKGADAVRAAGSEPIIKVCDVSVTDNVVQLFEEAEAETGGLDIVHNNAGIMAGEPFFPDTPMGKMIAVIQINLLAMMVGTRKSIELMRARSAAGVIINTCSVAAFSPMAADPAYSTSKAGILNFTQSCEPLKEAFNIRVMAICPGIVDTAIVPLDAEWLKPALEAVKILEPKDIADAVKTVIDDESLYGDQITINNEMAG
ncbi:MAG: SDR family NAD(P)-dependent oxidoreductase [Gammaproteobacteria bacterium]|nr:SDR family NAD(P)-dependent oxidoreductase [Gammaproteobacteria bacterium]